MSGWNMFVSTMLLNYIHKTKVHVSVFQNILFSQYKCMSWTLMFHTAVCSHVSLFLSKHPIHTWYSVEITNKMQPCNRIYYSTVHWRLPLRLDYDRSPHAYVNQRLQIQLELLMMSNCHSKHVEPSMNGGIINSITRLHLVGHFYCIILRCRDPWILNLHTW